MVRRTLAVWSLSLLLLPACPREDPPVRSSGAQKQTTTATTQPSPAAKRAVHPNPIDCPLRKAGINPHGLKPFKDVDKYIAFLERRDRAVWQKPDDVVAALDLAGDETVVDVGAGSGYFTFRFAKALPRGKVVAIDIQPEMVRHIHHKAMSTSVKNVEVVLATAADPKVPSGADLVFICDVLHHVQHRAAWLKKVAGAMKRGTTLAMIEFKEGKLPEGPPESVKISRAELLNLVTSAGFKLRDEKRGLLPYQVFLLFQRT